MYVELISVKTLTGVLLFRIIGNRMIGVKTTIRDLQ